MNVVQGYFGLVIIRLNRFLSLRIGNSLLRSLTSFRTMIGNLVYGARDLWFCQRGVGVVGKEVRGWDGVLDASVVLCHRVLKVTV